MNDRTIPTVVLTPQDVDIIEVLAPQRPCRFSCNGRDIWPTDEWGYSRDAFRRYLDIPCSGLEQLQRLLLQIDGRGGRMLVSLRHGIAVHLASNQIMARLECQDAA